VIDNHGRIGRDDDAGAGERKDGARLRFGDALNVRLRRFVRVKRLVGVGGLDVEVESRRAQQFGAAGRLRGEEEAH